MIPECDVTPTIDVDYASLRVLTAYQVVEGFAVVRDYLSLIDVGWDDARECVRAETRWLDRAAKAPTAEEFDPDRMKPGPACITAGHLRGGCAFTFSWEGLTPVAGEGARRCKTRGASGRLSPDLRVGRVLGITGAGGFMADCRASWRAGESGVVHDVPDGVL